jgi:polyisoprenoid-binding protein YceI
MKKNIFSLFAIVIIGISIIGFKSNTQNTSIKIDDTLRSNTVSRAYTVNVETSTIEWQGFKPTGSHTGTINIKSGVLKTKGNSVKSGLFIIDMSTIKESKNNAKLEGHLKSDAFFDVEKFPSAAFEITGFEDHNGKTMLSGNLTLKDITNNVTFPVTVTHQDDNLTLSSEVFTIDRSKWNVKYGSKSFFDDLKDKFINDDIELKITVKANKSI